MINLLITFSYDGSKFHGFQRQKKERSVQKDLEDVLSYSFQETIVIKGAGRTDAKVHAEGQCANFFVNKNIKRKVLKNIKESINLNLKDIVIKKIKIVDNDFHARFNAKEKKYVYKMTLDKDKDFKYYGFYYGNIDYKIMKKTSKIFEGTHDFNNFVAGSRDDYHTFIKTIKVKKVKNEIYFTFVGSGFYRYMVRNLVGALIDLGKGKVNLIELKRMLDYPSDEKSLSTAKAEGLYLMYVKY